jgi:hypothetical protein
MTPLPDERPRTQPEIRARVDAIEAEIERLRAEARALRAECGGQGGTGHELQPPPFSICEDERRCIRCHGTFYLPGKPITLRMPNGEQVICTGHYFNVPPLE